MLQRIFPFYRICLRNAQRSSFPSPRPQRRDRETSESEEPFRVDFVNNCTHPNDMTQPEENPFTAILKRSEDLAVNAHRELSLTSLDKYFEQIKLENKAVDKYRQEYEKSRRNLAEMMDRDPSEFTDQEVQQSLQYLMPSSLTARENRPNLIAPGKAIQASEVSRFDGDGRPLSYLFYTGFERFYSALNDIATQADILSKLAEDGSADSSKFEMADYRWLSDDQLRRKLKDKTLTPQMCGQIRESLRVLADMDYSSHCTEFIKSFCGELTVLSHEKKLDSIVTSKDGVTYIRGKGTRKTASAKVLVKHPGDGLVVINGQSILYFNSIINRRQLIGPLHLTNLINKVDILATVHGGGDSSQAGALRLGIARGISSLVSKEEAEKLRQAGYLTRDPRVKERKKPGKEGARRGFTWLKR